MAAALGVTAQAEAPAPLPQARVMMVSCRGADGMWAVLARATPRPAAEGWNWDLATDALRDKEVVAGYRTTAAAPSGMDGPPATAGLSWTQLDEGSQRVWTPDHLLLVPPPKSGRSRGTLSAVTVEHPQGPCEGAVLTNGDAVKMPARGESVLLLVLPFDSTAVAVMPDAQVATTALVAVEPPGPRGKKVALPLVTGLTRGDGRARLERVDVRLDGATKRPVGVAWRVTLFPSRAVGLLTSQAMVGPAPGVLLHQVSGAMQAGPVRGVVHGLLLENTAGNP